MKNPMKNMKNIVARRRELLTLLSSGALAALGAGGFFVASPAAAAAGTPALVPLTGADPTAKSLHYTEDSSKVDAAVNPSHKPDQKCATCAQYQGKAGEARGGCNIYPGKSVSSNGWCMVWAQKP